MNRLWLPIGTTLVLISGFARLNQPEFGPDGVYASWRSQMSGLCLAGAVLCIWFWLDGIRCIATATREAVKRGKDAVLDRLRESFTIVPEAACLSTADIDRR